MNGSIVYFAYGSNLHAPQMRERCPHSEVLRPAVLQGYRLTFAGFSRNWGGGAATIVPAPGNSVHGLLYHMTDTDLHSLNRFEGYPTVYEHLPVQVATRDGEFVDALTYSKLDTTPNPPSLRYLHQIWRGFRAHGLDDDLLLRAIEESLDSNPEAHRPWQAGLR